MPWQFWLGLALGTPIGGVIGFLLGRFAAGQAVIARDIKREDAIAQKADTDRGAVEAQLQKDIADTKAAEATELKNAMEKDFLDDDLTPVGKLPKP